MIGIFLTFKIETQRLFIIILWTAVVHSFVLKSSTHLVVYIQVSPLNANYMFVLPEVEIDITWYLKWLYQVWNIIFNLFCSQILI